MEFCPVSVQQFELCVNTSVALKGVVLQQNTSLQQGIVCLAHAQTDLAVNWILAVVGALWILYLEITFERRVRRALQHFDLNALGHALAAQMAAAAGA